MRECHARLLLFYVIFTPCLIVHAIVFDIRCLLSAPGRHAALPRHMFDVVYRRYIILE